jgi:hypothetical protein
VHLHQGEVLLHRGVQVQGKIIYFLFFYHTHVNSLRQWN